MKNGSAFLKTAAQSCHFFYSKYSKDQPKLFLLTSKACFFILFFFVQGFVHNVSYETAVNVSGGATESAG